MSESWAAVAFLVSSGAAAPDRGEGPTNPTLRAGGEKTDNIGGRRPVG